MQEILAVGLPRTGLGQGHHPGVTVLEDSQVCRWAGAVWASPIPPSPLFNKGVTRSALSKGLPHPEPPQGSPILRAGSQGPVGSDSTCLPDSRPSTSLISSWNSS